MIILGDLASPNTNTSDLISNTISAYPSIFLAKRVICNFEGLIYDGEELKTNEPILYNHSSILRAFSQGQKAILCLANNHTLDMSHQFESTINLFNSEDHLYCGAGKKLMEAEQPVLFSEGDRNFALFNACWDFLLYNHKNPRSGIHVAEIKEKQLIEKVRRFREEEPNRSIIVYLHWSLDLETLPFPMYRQFSKDLISAGTDLVVGTHSHCVQGGEKYKDGYIIYGLGNFLIPDNEYASGRLNFPSFAKPELILEWDTVNNKIVCHWFEYLNDNNRHQLKYNGSDDFEKSARLEEFSPFRGMTNQEYLKYFKKNRRKKILIPVYRNYKRKRINTLYTLFLKTRARSAHFLAKINLIKWQN